MFGKFPNMFEVAPVEFSTGWTLPEAGPTPDIDWQADEAKKKLFGIELSKQSGNPFLAACNVFEDASKAMWASKFWVTDPVVIGARDAYQKTVEVECKLLDKTQFSVTVLNLAENSDLEGRDRIAALKLYAEVQGWLNKAVIDASTNNFTNNNEMQIVLVKATKTEEIKTVEHIPDDISDDELPINIKLVASSSR